MPVPKPASKRMTSTWDHVVISIKLALKNYEQIAILFLLPSLFLILGAHYFGDPFIRKNKLVLNFSLSNQQEIGMILMAVWLLISIVNYAPAIYLRLKAVETNTSPSLTECYREGTKLFKRVWLSQIISWVIILAGVILLIVPGIIFFRRYILSPYYAAKYPQLKLAQVFRRSADQSRPFAGYIYATFGIMILIDLVLSDLLGAFTLSQVAYYILSYGILFLPSLRFVEILKASAHSVNKGRTESRQIV
jgi:hypothetical protein